MSDSAEQNRSELPTPFKLKRAREKGSVARGMDLGFAVGLAAFCGYVWLAGASAQARLGEAARMALVAAPSLLASGEAITTVTARVLGAAVRPIGFLAVMVFLAVLVFEIIQIGGLVFSAQPLKPDFNRLNPGQNLKRLFSVRLLIETGKNILKLAVYTTLAYVVVTEARTTVAAAVTDAGGLAHAMGRMGLKLLVMFLVAAVALAGLDQLLSRRQFLKQMRMSRREMRREARDREGEPRQKQKRKQLHREFVNASRSLQGIKGADVVITNPQHLAVALKYTPGRMEAPKVVAKGADQFAQRLKRLAFLYGLVIIENRLLARALHQGVELGDAVPEALYDPVVEVYRTVRDRRKLRSVASDA